MMKPMVWMILLFPALTALVGFASGLMAGEHAEKKSANTLDQQARQQLLHTVGALAAAHLYQSYLNIGFLADGKAEGTYEEKDAVQILSSVVGLMDALNQQLDAVAKFDLDQEDRKSLEECREISALLRQQADELQAFWRTGDKKHGEKYDSLRQQSWQRVSKLLGLD
jgi:hypothetical protein